MTSTTLYILPFGILAVFLVGLLVARYQPPLWLKRAGPWIAGALALAAIALELIPHR